jgi:hypothetical protein
VYLVISSYDGFDQLSIPESKRDLVIQDLTLLQQKVDTKKVTLIISSEISHEIEQLGINLNDYFKQVHSPVGTKLLKYLTEYLVGKSISGSKPSFQGMLKFDSASCDTDMVMARFAKYDLNQGVSSTIRRNGRIQINTEAKSAHSRFFIMLKHAEGAVFKLSEEVTGTQFEIVHRTLENIPDITDDHFNALMSAVTFLEKFNSKKDSESVNKFIESNLESVSRHIFTSPLASFDELESKSDLSSMIIEYGSSLRSQIYCLLTAVAGNTNLRKTRPNKKRVIFGENEIGQAVTSFVSPYYSSDTARSYTQNPPHGPLGATLQHFSSAADTN